MWADTLAAIPSVLPQNAVIEVWNNRTLLGEALKGGRDAILALGWYLDRQVPVDNATHWFWLDTWADMYGVDPTPPIVTAPVPTPVFATLPLPNTGNTSGGAAGAAGGRGAAFVGKVLGGEANMWSEQVSALSLDTRVWPRTCAVAERLWSTLPTTPSYADIGWAAQRLSAHRCRMASRGIKASDKLPSTSLRRRSLLLFFSPLFLHNSRTLIGC